MSRRTPQPPGEIDWVDGEVVEREQQEADTGKQGELAGNAAERKYDPAAAEIPEAVYVWLFPNVMLNVYLGQMQTNQVLPLSHDRTRVTFDLTFGILRELLVRELGRKVVWAGNAYIPCKEAFPDGTFLNLTGNTSLTSLPSLVQEEILRLLIERDLIPDDVHIFTLEFFQAGGRKGYPWGAHVCIAGAEKEGRVLYRGELSGTQKVGDRYRKEALPLPVAQFKQFGEGLLDFYGVGAMTILGPGNEARATFVASLVEHLDRFNRRKVFYDPNSLFQPKAANAAMGTYIPIAAGSEPRFEQVPDYPRAGTDNAVVDLYLMNPDDSGHSSE